MLFYLRTSASVYEQQLGGLPSPLILSPPPLQLFIPAPLQVFSPSPLFFCLNQPSINLGTPQQVTTCALDTCTVFLINDGQLTLTQLFLAGIGCYFANLSQVVIIWRGLGTGQ